MMSDINLSGVGKVIHPVTYVAGKTMVIHGETIKPGDHISETQYWDEKLITKLLRTGHLRKVNIDLSVLARSTRAEGSSTTEDLSFMPMKGVKRK